MKSLALIILALLIGLATCAQQPSNIDSLKRALTTAKEDTNKVNLLADLAEQYNVYRRPDSVLIVWQEALQLATQLHNPEMIAGIKGSLASALWVLGDYLQADKYFSEELKFLESKPGFTDFGIYEIIASNKRDKGDYREALYYSFKGDSLDKAAKPGRVWGLGKLITGSIYVEMNMADSALYYLKQGYPEWDYSKWLMGRGYEHKGNNKLAYDYYHESFSGLSKGYNLKDLANVCISLSQFFRKQGKIDSAIYYAKTGYDAAAEGHYTKGAWELGLLLSAVYEGKDAGLALQYYKLAMAAKDKLFDIQKTTKFLNTQFNEQFEQQQAEADRVTYQNRIRIYMLLGTLGFFLVIAAILYRNNRHKQKANIKIEKAYIELKSAQSQLIQSEKMASLGQLTAGIAHEIQNPLNFVNNFAEVNAELIDEMKEEFKQGITNVALNIADDIKENNNKIAEHGKRADSIVKSMLQHSRNTSSKKELTDISALADEYLRHSYHGFRAKDQAFNVTLQTDFDNSIGKINIIPQDIGRVLLNLYNNAFYAVNEKRKTADETYKPEVAVQTKKLNNKVEIKVSDNGYGIPQKIIDKIYQPFFTTKPTGQGTGLGLSLSYDIIKAHGGEIEVETKENEGAEFKITLPIS